MRTSGLNYAIVGAFVLAAVVGLVAALALLAGRTGSTDSYYTVYGNVSGVKYGTQVMYEGYPVGQVEDIEPLSDNGNMRFRVEMSIAEGWPIPQDSSADVMASGFLGGVVVNISGGDSPVALEPGSRIPGRAPTNLFATLSEVAAGFQDLSESSIEPLLNSLNETIGAVNGPLAEQAPEILRQVQSITEDFARRSPDLLSNLTEAARGLNEEVLSPENIRGISATIRNAEGASQEMKTLASELVEMRRNIGGVIAQIDTLVSDNSDEVNEAMQDLRYTMGTIARDIDTITYNLDATSRNMLEFSQSIRQDPSLILRSRDVPERGPGTGR
ncbi:MlaD family protein [Caenispirillum bisanense]|uniref:Phospholipid/cholesterol/gamma-HCH transport system substrate-binding protein n=1 Tax=Caenispirillum bisanense TaxID=414052 RepID=A0A286G8G6_9PROT|nr:MlaD family protein [Caenispirillum bisanense]SOD91820.1 phospholipid/cholesterol/gamma-HCH transport system substrate-binding protein [Caenispirillum bisanense]